MKIKSSFILEWTGVLTAIFYSFLVSLNIGTEFYGFSLLIISAILLACWSFINDYKGILLLQLFYAIACIIGVIRWYD